MNTTARILAGLGTGVLVLGLAAFRDPKAFSQVQADGAHWRQARMTPSSIIASSLQSFTEGSAPGYDRYLPPRSAWSPWNGSPAYIRDADDEDDRGGRDHDRDRRDDRRDRDDDRGGWWNRRHDNGRHNGWYKQDRDRDDNHGGWWNWGRDRDDRGGWNRRDRHGRDHRRHDDDDD